MAIIFQGKAIKTKQNHHKLNVTRNNLVFLRAPKFSFIIGAKCIQSIIKNAPTKLYTCTIYYNEKRYTYSH
jgi:hypothetical protein